MPPEPTPPSTPDQTTDPADRKPLTPTEHSARAEAITSSRTYGEASKKLKEQGDEVSAEALQRYGTRYGLAPLGQLGSTVKATQRLKAAEEAIERVADIVANATTTTGINPALVVGQVYEVVHHYQLRRMEIG